MCGFLDSRQGAMTRNGYSISRNCNAAMDSKNRAIHFVANLPRERRENTIKQPIRIMPLRIYQNGQLRFLGLYIDLHVFIDFAAV